MMNDALVPNMNRGLSVLSRVSVYAGFDEKATWSATKQ